MTDVDHVAIDRLVAERAMRWKLIPWCGDGDRVFRIGEPGSAKRCPDFLNEPVLSCPDMQEESYPPQECVYSRLCWTGPYGKIKFGYDWSPSTDAAHCRMVEDKMLLDYDLYTTRHGDTGRVTVELGQRQIDPHPAKDPYEEYHIYDREDGNYNLAICIAALKAVGVPEAEIRAALGEEG